MWKEKQKTRAIEYKCMEKKLKPTYNSYDSKSQLIVIAKRASARIDFRQDYSVWLNEYA